MSRTLHGSYLAAAMQRNAFLPRGAGDANDRRARVDEARARKIAPAILTELRTQNPTLRDDTIFVATGQQVGLFLGPLYTLYKAAGAITWARLLEHETGVRTAPLFWLQTEDHDFAEIASTVLPRSGDAPALTLQIHSDDARICVAERRLGDDVRALHKELEETIRHEAHGPAVLAAIARHYVPGARLADAFRGLLAEIFPELVIFDPRNAAVARAASPLIQRSFERAAAIDQALIDRKRALEADGYEEQIRTRPGSSLAFVHDEHGARHRLLRRGEHFHWPDAAQPKAWTLAEIASLDPLRFSTSALLRPIVQDTLLPVALYVGGPAEVAYFGQATALYPLFDQPPPLIALRPRFRLLTPRSRALLTELSLAPDDVDLGTDALYTKLARGRTTLPSSDWRSGFDKELAALVAADPSLARAAKKTRDRVERAHASLRRRYDRGLTLNDATLRARLERLQRWLRPNGEPQERVHGFIAYAARVGLQTLAKELIARADPLQPALKDIAL